MTQAPHTPLRSAQVAFTGRLASLPRETAEHLVRSAGGTVVPHVSRRTSVLIVGMDGWPLAADGKVNHRLQQAERINRDGRRIRIIGELEFLELVEKRGRPSQTHKTQSAADIARLLGIEPRVLRHWEALGLVRAVEGRFDFQDIVSLRTIAGLVGRGVRPDVISRSLHDLAALLPGTHRPLSQLRIVADGPKSLLAELDEHLVAPDGQLVMNFGSPEAAPERAALTMLSSSDWFARGEEFEQNDDFEQAAGAYQRAIALSAGCSEALFNLGNVLRALGRTDDARASFRAAIDCDPGMSEAWYNLADLQEEEGDLEGTAASLLMALRADPAYADAHFNLANCLEQLGRGGEAQKHWSAYLRLDGTSEWAEIAESKLAACP